MIRIESLLSARLFLRPQLVKDRIFFLSNLSGHINLYVMDYGGSVPEPLLPPHIALQNPHLIGGHSFMVFPKLNKILVMIDRDGDENYQPMLIPLDGGFPEPAFDNFFAEYRCHLGSCNLENNIFYLAAESRKEQMIKSYQCHLDTGELIKLAESPWGAYPEGMSDDHTKVIILDGYSIGDNVLYLWDQTAKGLRLIYGVPLEKREAGQEVPLNAINHIHFTASQKGIIFVTVLFSDTGSLGYLDLNDPDSVLPVAIHGIHHKGQGELESCEHLTDNRYTLTYNIDGCSWLYEGEFDESTLSFTINHTICGDGLISNGVLEAASYEKSSDRFTLAFSTAVSPTQIYTVEDQGRNLVFRHTSERILGIETSRLSAGEDASFTSFDGTRVSARLYMPSSTLGFEGPRPVVYYVHGGPQGQERPDFAWFSMPLIQFLTLKGFAVFVPNVRGSTGYGLSYTKQVDKDWGGMDRLDHVHAMTRILPGDKRLDVKRAGVVGRSYGGYMTLTLASRHTELWSAAVDMFGPYDLVTFLHRIPSTWKPYFKLVLGDPENDADRGFLVERSPKTYMHQIACPLLVIQGKNDPRVVEAESRDVVENLRAVGKQVDYLMFENEGHDVLKFENRVACYDAITEYFVKYLKP